MFVREDIKDLEKIWIITYLKTETILQRLSKQNVNFNHNLGIFSKRFPQKSM